MFLKIKKQKQPGALWEAGEGTLVSSKYLLYHMPY